MAHVMWPYYPAIYAHFLLWVRYQFSARSSSCFLVSFLTFLVWFHPFPSILFQFLVGSLCSIIFASGCHIVFPSCPYFPHVSLIFHSFPMLFPRTPLSQKRSPEPFTAAARLGRAGTVELLLDSQKDRGIVDARCGRREQCLGADK